MGKVLSFPSLANPGQVGGGVVHVSHWNEGGYEVAHESSSGSSWGGFEHHDDPQAAVAAAFRLAREVYHCGVSVPRDIIASLPETPGPEGFF